MKKMPLPLRSLFLLLPALPVFFPAAADAQKRLHVQHACAVDDAEMGRDHYVFEPSAEAQRIVRIIMEANSLKPNFTIRSGDVDNALAFEDQGKRYIVYNTVFIERIKNSAGADWAAFFVFAHEIGHHLNFHSFTGGDPERQIEQELEADVFAGGIMYMLGAGLNEVRAGVENVCKERGSLTHPPRRARVEAVANGWKRAKERVPVQPPRVNFKDTPEMPDNMVFIRGGTFLMGSNDGESDEKPAHSVTVSDFYLGKYEVTVAEFRAFVENTGYRTDAEKEGSSRAFEDGKWVDKQGRNWRHDPEGNPARDNHPVINVSWNDAAAYCEWLSRKTGKTYRLPTEAEWEYAAGNGSRHTKYSWGNGDPSGKNGGSLADETGAGHFNWARSATNIFLGYTDGYAATAPVGSFSPNDFGLHDMSGNAWEWCADRYGSDYYKNSPSSNPTGPASGSLRVRRGGSWFYDPQSCRVAYRYDDSPGYRDDDAGFRLARTN